MSGLPDSNPSERPGAVLVQLRDELRAIAEGKPTTLNAGEADTFAAHLDALAARVRELDSALERVTHNFRLAVQGKPVRDMAETLAEVEAALAAGERETSS